MKREENNLEKNISRLVKLTGDSEKPAKAFSDSVVEGALSELERAGRGGKREEGGKTMKINFKRALSWAAVIVIGCGIGLGVLTYNFGQKIQMIGPISARKDLGDESGKKAIQDYKGPKAAKIEYTERARKPIEVARAKPALSQPVERVVALDAQSQQVVKDTATSTRVEIEYTEVASQPVASAEPVQSYQLSMDKTAATVEKKLAEANAKATEALKMAKADTELREKEAYRLGMQAEKRYSSRKARRPASESAVSGMICPPLGPPGYAPPGFAPPGYGLPGCAPPGYGLPGCAPPAHGGTTPPNGEAVDAMFFKNYGVNPFVDTEDDHLSTFATDVDTGSYTICRGYLHDGHLPEEKAVRVEEFINYFKYGYAAPQEDTFAVYAEAAQWTFGTGRKNSYLLRLGLKAKQVSDENRKPAILTFVIDVSGSMNRENRLGLVKRSLRMLVERLKKEDRIGIAVYGSRGRKVMDYKGLDEKAEILAAINSLGAGGSTYAEEGIRIGYDMAESAYKKGFINRVILCSDGVANVGQTGADDILKVIKAKADKGITLSAIGFGMGNYNDVLMERLGDKGNGHYTYIDTIAEAKRIFEDNLTGTLQVIARDVKAQVDFNPEVVRSYRLIGYENRDVPDDKFRDDKYDGGEVGAGHSVTALYELKLWPDKKGTVATTYVRYKDPDTMAVTEFKSSIGTDEFTKSLDYASREFRLAATVGEFAEILRKSYWAKGATLDSVLERTQKLSKESKGDADVIELADLISKARQLMKTEDVNPVEIEEDIGKLQE
jgi:Ca-activated chloride channel family protein